MVVNQQIVLGQASGNLLTARPSDLKAHTLIVGQSGSGKSFFLARFMEEILLRTRARIVAIDPNGDFDSFFAGREGDFWSEGEFASRLNNLNKSQITSGLSALDNKDSFVAGWSKVLFQHVVIGRKGRPILSDNAFAADLKLHWKNLDPPIQNFLLGVDSTTAPKKVQGIATCHHLVNTQPGNYPHGVSLKDLEDIALDFETKNIVPSLSAHRDTMSLSSDDWAGVRMAFRHVRKKYGRLLHAHRLKNEARDTIPSGLSNYIYRSFSAANTEPWQFLSVGLAGAHLNHSLLACWVTLSNIWRQSLKTWQQAKNQKLESVLESTVPTGPNLGEFDSIGESADDEDTHTFEEEQGHEKTTFRPTFIVIDEAHNFLPEESTSPLQEMVSDLIVTIAAEGRKYGIFLVLSTQRPQKLRKGVAAECDNAAVLKLQSILERQYLSETVGISNVVNDAHTLKLGDVLIHGRWMGGETRNTVFAPARTILGGADIPDSNWLD